MFLTAFGAGLIIERLFPPSLASLGANVRNSVLPTTDLDCVPHDGELRYRKLPLNEDEDINVRPLRMPVNPNQRRHAEPRQDDDLPEHHDLLYLERCS